MGSDASIFEFEYAHYTGEVVPAFRQLLLTGEMTPWLQELWDKEAAVHGPYFDLEELGHTDLLQYCTYLNPVDFAYPGPVVREFGRSVPWGTRSCKSISCPERTACPFHAGREGALWENLMVLVEEAVQIHCLPRGQWVGRTMYLERYAPLLTTLGISEYDPLRELLAKLGSRGYAVGVDIGDLEGIHGWLMPDETVRLWKALDRFELPCYPASYEEMESILQAARADPNLSREEFRWISLSFVRTVSYLAMENGLGILWGNDLVTSELRREEIR